MSTVISIEDVSKLYRLGEIGTGSLAHDVNRWWHKVRGKDDPYLRVGVTNDRTTYGDSDYVFAVKDVSFEVKQGDALGIIGRNGAGKSTLLKILSRVTTPTSGRIRVKGRIASLLEVGTGFHPELTGRENIYLNGAILGMRKEEIRTNFDEIVDFSGCERYIDTPVKRYSSGMYVRLAFAVAAHLNPEILIVDEVLAVGDVSFQKKCLGKMSDVAREGRTVIFVSHSMPAVTRLCNRAILMDNGAIEDMGTPEAISRRYLNFGTRHHAERRWVDRSSAPGDGVAKLSSVRILNIHNKVAERIDISEAADVEIEYWNIEGGAKVTVSIHLVNEDGVLLFVSNDFINREWWTADRKAGIVRMRCRIPANLLAEGRIAVLAALCSYDPDIIHALEPDAISFVVVDQYDQDGIKDKYSQPWPGVIRPRLAWQSQQLGNL